KQADVLGDIFQAIEKKDDANQKQQVIVAGHHVFRPEIHERTDRPSLESLQEHRVLARHAMRARHLGKDPEQQRSEDRSSYKAVLDTHEFTLIVLILVLVLRLRDVAPLIAADTSDGSCRTRC